MKSDRVQVAAFYAAKGKVEDAERELKAGIALNGKSFKLRFALADLYLNLGKTDQAITLLNECLGLDKKETNPDIIQAKNALARIYLMKRDIDKATQYADEVIAASPKNVDGHFILGTIYLAKGDGTKAVAEFRTVVGERPQQIDGHLRLAEAHLASKDPKLALDTLRNALKIAPGFPGRHARHRALLRLAEGLPECRGAVAGDPQEAPR